MAKKKLTKDQEFQVMKLVLDKFLWLGFIVMGWGMFITIRDMLLTPGIWYMLTGAILLILFVVLVVKEYETLR